LKAVNDNTARLQRQLATLQSTYYLEQRNKQLNFGLVQPAQSQILTIVEVPATAAPKGQPTSVEKPIGRIALK
jgi:hypothetical protein